MPALFIFLLKANAALLLFCGGYYLILRQLTFYTLNRAYLITGILFATAYPYVDLSSFAVRHEALARPVQTVIYKWQLPAQQILNRPNYWQWLIVLFWAGVVFLGIRFLMQLFSLYILYHNSKPQSIHNHNVRVIKGDAAPFSFWRSIYINPDKHSRNDLEAILQHEQEHVNGWHTIDIILAELSCIFYWFNPGIWLMKKAVRENIEFITDRRILSNGMDSKSYQYSLINVGFNNHTPGIVNHFNLSTIKKRIIMMNAKRSSRATLTRYAFVIPIVVCSLLVFTISKADVAKPLTIKLFNAIKPVTISLKEAAKNATHIFNDTIPAKRFITKRDTGKRKEIRLFTVKSDTSKKKLFVIKTDKYHTLDSMNIIVDGKKISKEELAKLDPNTIANVTVVNDADAKFYNEKFGFDSKNKVIVIDTKNSEFGKQMAQGVGTITINGVAKDPTKLTDKEKALIATLPNSDNLHGTVSQLTITRHADAPKTDGVIKDVVINGKRLENVFLTTIDSKDTVRIVEDYPTAATYNTKAQPTDVVVRAYKTERKPTDAVVVQGYQTNRNPTNDVIVKGYPTTLNIRSGSLNKISDKAIVIDGKLASEKEMQKLSAYDIDSIDVARISSAETVKKYGDKAKNGVVYITTKKVKNK